jgi:hypothetical protein
MDPIPHTEKKKLISYFNRYTSIKATCAALVCSFLPMFDIPVYWPILLIYFCILFALTMRRQIQHMVRYRYVPFDFGKRKYQKVVPVEGESSAE